jgi:hypothetical protein
MLGVSSRKRRKRGLLFTSAKSLKRNRMVRTRRSSEEKCDITDIAKVLSYDDEGQENQLEGIPETHEGESSGSEAHDAPRSDDRDDNDEESVSLET